eukprot:1345353-Amorphochlora_amoeboformis.AAC.2
MGITITQDHNKHENDNPIQALKDRNKINIKRLKLCHKFKDNPARTARVEKAAALICQEIDRWATETTTPALLFFSLFFLKSPRLTLTMPRLTLTIPHVQSSSGGERTSTPVLYFDFSQKSSPTSTIRASTPVLALYASLNSLTLTPIMHRRCGVIQVKGKPGYSALSRQEPNPNQTLSRPEPKPEPKPTLFNPTQAGRTPVPSV